MGSVKIDKPRLFTTFLFLSVLFIIILFIQIQSLIVYRYYYDAALKTAQTRNSAHLRLMRYNLDYFDSSTRRLIMQIFSDEVFLEFSEKGSYGEINPIQFTRMQQRLAYYLNLFPEIDSLYLYNRKIGYLLSLSLQENLSSGWRDNFHDGDLIKILETGDFKELTLIPRDRRIYPPEFKTNNYVYTYVKTDATPLKPNYDYGVIVNLRYDWLNELLQSMKGNDNIELVLLDGENRVIGGTDRHELFKPYLPDTGKPITEYQEEGIWYTAAAMEVPGSDFKLISIVPREELLSGLDGLRRKLFYLALVMMVTGLSLSYFLAVKFTKPLEELYDKSINLERFRRDNKNYLKQKLLADLLGSPAGPDSEKRYRSLAEERDLKIDLSQGAVLLIFDTGERLKEKTEKELQRIIQRLSEKLNPLGPHETTSLRRGYVTVILQSRDGDLYSEERLGPIEKARAYLCRETGDEVCAGISNLLRHPEELNFAYEETCAIMAEEYFHSERTLVYEHDRPVKVKKIGELVNDYGGRIQEILGRLGFDELKETYDEMAGHLFQYGYEDSVFFFNHMAFLVHEALRENNALRNCHFQLAPVLREISAQRTIRAINALFRELFDEMESAYSREENRYYLDLAERAKKHIDRNFSDPNLSLKGIAAKFSFTPGYFSSIFRKHNHVSVQDYIYEKRIAAAKERLGTDKNCTVAELYHQVGFVSKTHFFTIFKRLTGMTPKKYQRELLSGKTE